MATLLSPGVSVREIDLTGIVPSVASTEGAIAGQFNWGPVNQRKLVESEAQLVSLFGKPDNANADDWFTASSFLAYTNKLYVVRAVDESNITPALQARNATAANTTGFLVRNDEEYENKYATGNLNSTYGAGSWIARYPGSLGNSLKIAVCPSAEAYQSNLAGTVTTVAGSTTVTGTGTAFTTAMTESDFIVIGNEAYKVVSITSATALTVNRGITVASTAVAAKRRWEYYAFTNSAPTTSTNASRVGGSADEMHVVVVDGNGLWTGQKGTVLEVYQNVSKAVDAKLEDGSTNYYVNVVNTKSKYVRWAGHASTITGAGGKSTVNFVAVPLALSYTLVGGNDGAAIGNAERIRGYNFFASKEDVDISFVLGAAANQTVAVHIINNITENRKDCVAFFSPPRSFVVDNEDDEAFDITTFKASLPSSSYYSLSCNWKYTYDVYNDLYRYIPDNGDIAGLYARTDNEQEAWVTAAGLNRGHIKNVIKLAWNPSNAERDILYSAGVNPVATFSGEGTVLWGNKTGLSKPSAFDRMNVRRLFIVLEKAISKASRYMLFEFNDEFTRSQFVNMVEPYLRDVMGKRGIYDFRVVCDETNNTPEAIDRNEFIGDIYIKPARTAEFIYLNFVAVRSGVDFAEVVGKF